MRELKFSSISWKSAILEIKGIGKIVQSLYILWLFDQGIEGAIVNRTAKLSSQKKSRSLNLEMKQQTKRLQSPIVEASLDLGDGVCNYCIRRLRIGQI